MSSQLHTLRLVPAVRHARDQPDGGRRARREFLDLVIDGASLGDALRVYASTGVMADIASVLVTNWPGGFPAEDVMVLLGDRRPALADGRVPLYVCAECGSLGCGVVTVKVERTEDLVVWRDLGWQTDYDPYVDVEPYRDLGPFRFDRSSYETILRSLVRGGRSSAA